MIHNSVHTLNILRIVAFRYIKVKSKAIHDTTGHVVLCSTIGICINLQIHLAAAKWKMILLRVHSQKSQRNQSEPICEPYVIIFNVLWDYMYYFSKSRESIFNYQNPLLERRRRRKKNPIACMHYTRQSPIKSVFSILATTDANSKAITRQAT